MDSEIQARRTRILIILLTSLALLAVFHPYPYDNVVTRWALTRQLVDHLSLEIDEYSEITSDRAYSNGHYYCDKAVMTSVAAAVPYSAFSHTSRLAGFRISPSALRYIAERLTAGLALVILMMFIAKNLRESPVSPAIPMLAIGFGSILLPYSTLLYGHVPAALMLYLSWHFQRRGSWTRADLFGALAAAFEFPLLLPFAVLLLYRGRHYWSILRITRTAGFILLAFLPQLIHNLIAFGSPFTMGYSLETADAFTGMSRGLFGFTAPSLRSLYLLVLSPERGLLFYMPWTLLGFIGFFSGRSLREVVREDPLPLICVSYILLFSAYYMPSGGWAYGPRHLIPVIPFLCVGLVQWLKGGRKRVFLAALLLIPSILMALTGTFGEIHQPVHPVDAPVPLPQLNIGLAMMMDGHHSQWLLGIAGLIIVTVSSLLLTAAIMVRKGSFSWWGPAILVVWSALALISSFRDWGGRIDYYRGILAQHRQEWNLAAEYYERAAQDPSAPGIVVERARFCRSIAEND